MKKIIPSMLTLMVVAVMTVLSSCGGGASVEKIVEKYNANEYYALDDFTPEEFTACIDYFEEAMNEAIPLLEKIKTATEEGDDDEVVSLMKETEALEEDYPYAEVVGKILFYASDEQVGEDNVERRKALEEKLKEHGATFRF